MSREASLEQLSADTTTLKREGHVPAQRGKTCRCGHPTRLHWWREVSYTVVEQMRNDHRFVKVANVGPTNCSKCDCEAYNAVL